MHEFEEFQYPLLTSVIFVCVISVERKFAHSFHQYNKALLGCPEAGMDLSRPHV